MRYAVGTVIMTNTEEEFQSLMDLVMTLYEEYGIKLNVNKINIELLKVILGSNPGSVFCDVMSLSRSYMMWKTQKQKRQRGG